MQMLERFRQPRLMRLALGLTAYPRASMDVIARKPLVAHLAQVTLLFICIAAFAVAFGIDIRLRFLSQIPDEGVYWQSLRAMSAGYHLYREIFCSQPPLFLMSIYPVYELLGSTITSARISVFLLSLLALPGAYLIGRALARGVGSIAAVALLVVTPMYLQQSHLLRAEGPATGLLFLTVGAAFMWYRSIQSGERGWYSPFCVRLRWYLAF
jgi:4-amino-4-deoxy-L-arabinose transferase-like glycosyltransferase